MQPALYYVIMPITLFAGQKVRSCCATNAIVLGEKMYQDHPYPCPLHQEGHHPLPDAVSDHTLPGHISRVNSEQEERVALWITPPHYHYTNGVMVTGHRGISVSCRAELRILSLTRDDKPPQDSILVSEEWRLRQALPELRDEKGVEEMEVGKTFSSTSLAKSSFTSTLTDFLTALPKT